MAEGLLQLAFSNIFFFITVFYFDFLPLVAASVNHLRSLGYGNPSTLVGDGKFPQAEIQLLSRLFAWVKGPPAGEVGPLGERRRLDATGQGSAVKGTVARAWGG